MSLTQPRFVRTQSSQAGEFRVATTNNSVTELHFSQIKQQTTEIHVQLNSSLFTKTIGITTNNDDKIVLYIYIYIVHYMFVRRPTNNDNGDYC